MPGEQIQWFPGHMAKTRRLIAENAKNVHLFIEVLDARVPVSSRNPVLPELTGGKPVLLLLNKASLADPDKSRVFMRTYTDADTACLLCDCVTGEGLNRVPDTVRRLLAERVERYEAKGQTGLPSARNGRRHSQHGEIHAYQPSERRGATQNRESPRRNAGQAVGSHPMGN